MRNLKNIITLAFTIIFLISCEPETMPEEKEEVVSQFEFYSETGDQKDKPPAKDDNG